MNFLRLRRHVVGELSPFGGTMSVCRYLGYTFRWQHECTASGGRVGGELGKRHPRREEGKSVAI